MPVASRGFENAGLVVPASILGLIGLGLLIIRHWEFCITVPFMAIAYNCFQGNVGLRFTVHVGNYAAIGLVFTFCSKLGDSSTHG